MCFQILSTGQSFRSLAFSLLMEHNTAGKIVYQVSDVLWSKLSSKHVTVPDHDRFLDIAVKFRERWNFPNVIGCINEEHIRINPLAPELFFLLILAHPVYKM